MMPRSGKGGGRNRASRKSLRVPVPIGVELAMKLISAAKGRATDAPLLLQSDGSSWGSEPSRNYRKAVSEIVKAIGLGPETTLYALRHSSIVRQLLAHVPIRIIASTHDTSVAMIERFYSRFIADHSDEHTRRALLQPEPPSAESKVVQIQVSR